MFIHYFHFNKRIVAIIRKIKNVQSTFARRFCVAFLRHSSFAKACACSRSVFNIIGNFKEISYDIKKTLNKMFSV